ncbi:hypothetical protein LINGRAHAP2_LOCUS3473 [Linum grandiflorum]
MENFTLKITKELVDRLSGDEEKAKKRTRKPKPKVQPRRPQTKANEKPESKPQKVPVQPPIFVPALPPPPPVHPAIAELEAIRSVVQESEKVLEKLQKQEEHMVQEVTERAKDLHGKEFKLPYQKPMPCVADYEACRSCYKEHINDILRCSPLTKSYYECVQRVNQQAGSVDK